MQETSESNHPRYFWNKQPLGVVTFGEQNRYYKVDITELSLRNEKRKFVKEKNSSLNVKLNSSFYSLSLCYCSMGSYGWDLPA